MKVKTKFDIEQFVQLKTDEEKKRRIVVNFTVFSKSYIQYNLACGLEVSPHCESEIEPYTPQAHQGNHKEIEGFQRKELK